MLNGNRVYLLTKHEFLLLAATAGIQRLYGFDMKAEALGQEEAVYVLHSLTKRNYLQVVNEKFVLSEEMKTVFEHIKKAETVLDVHKSSGRSCILYIGGTTIKVAEAMRRKDMFEVMQIPLKDVWNHLLEEEWITGRC